MKIDRSQAMEAFAGYIAAYDPDEPKIRLKIDHTYRVAALCDRIARSAGLSDDETDLAWLCGLLHDIGRFEQVRRYGTFSDALSVRHADMSVAVLFEEGHIRDYAADGSCDGLIRTVVGTHSDFRLPEGLDMRTQTLCDVVRDADKVDILKAMYQSDMAQTLNVTQDAIRGSELSPAVVDAFYAHRTVLRTQRAYPADFLVSYACFVFEMVYPESLRIACEQGYVFRLLELPLERADTAAQLADMLAHLRLWLAGQGIGEVCA